MVRRLRRPVWNDGDLVSDDDREQAIDVLRERYADGSLALDEYSHRVDIVLHCRTRAQMRRALKGFEGALDRFVQVPSRRDRGSNPRRLLRLAAVPVAALIIFGVAVAYRSNGPRFDRGGLVVGTLDPFSAVPAADIYIVPLDRPAWDANGAFSLLRLQHELSERGLRTVLTAPLAISKAVWDSHRHQVDGDALSFVLDAAYGRHPSPRPPTVIGVTSLDLYSPTYAGDRFVFMASHARGHAGFAVVSTARMHSGFFGGGSAADLEKMALRAVGLYFYRLPRTPGWSLMHDPIRSLSDLERMSEQYGVPHTLLERRQQQAERRTTPY